MRRIATFAAGVVFACAPIRRQPSPTAPTNVCPDHPCSAYSPGAPVCVAGVCVKQPTATADHLALVIAIPVDAPTLPGGTFVVPFADLRSPAADGGAGQLRAATPGGTLPPVSLPPLASITGGYLVQASTTIALGWNLGNLDTSMYTSMPVHVTYRPLWPPNDVAADAGLPSRNDAIAAGLPLYPLEVQSVPNASLAFLAFGPAHGPAMGFETSAESGLFYEQTIAPDPPFDQAYPPDVQIVSLNPGGNTETVFPLIPDTTIETGNGGIRVIPAFDLTRTDRLDGWTAYLRDATTKRPISPIRPLGGTTTHVLLPTSHHPSTGDALSNAELVMAPPDGLSLPTYVLAPQGNQLFAQQNYPLVPAMATITGRIDWSDQQAVAADVVFEATGIYAFLPMADPVDASSGTDGGVGDAGVTFTLQRNQKLQYVARTTAEPDPMAPGTSTYQVTLPRGEYRVIVRPRDANVVDASQETAHEVTIFDGFDTLVGGNTAPPPLTVDVAHKIDGSAVVADGRGLSEATVEALPLHCPVPNGPGSTAMDAPSCMPRYRTAITDDLGAFSFALDPGDYLIRVAPADGTHLPWVSQAIHVPSSKPLEVTIPAPVFLGLELHDPSRNPIASAVVRMFTLPANGSAIEVGRTITDTSGRFEVYLDPGVQ